LALRRLYDGSTTALHPLDDRRVGDLEPGVHRVHIRSAMASHPLGDGVHIRSTIASHSLDGGAGVAAELLGAIGRTGLRDDADDGFRVAGPDVNPAVFEVDAHAVLTVYDAACKGGGDAVERIGETGAVDLEFLLSDGVTGHFVDEGRQASLVASEHFEDEGHGDGAVPDVPDARVDDAAVPLSADHRTLGDHSLGDVDLSDLGTDDCGAGGSRGVLGEPAGRSVDDDRAEFLGKSMADGKSKGVFLADVAAGLVDESEPVRVGVDGEAHVGAGLAHFGGQTSKVFLDRFGFVLKTAVRFAAEEDDVAAQCGKQSRTEGRARRVVCVEDDPEPASGDGVDVDARENLLEVGAVRVVDGFGGRNAVPGDAGPSALSVGFGDSFALLRAEDESLGAEEFKTVPGLGVVAGGDLYGAGGAGRLGVEAAGGSCGDVDVLDATTDGEEAGHDGVAEHGAGGSAVPANDDFLTV
jgi:hypothetical protein